MHYKALILKEFQILKKKTFLHVSNKNSVQQKQFPLQKQRLIAHNALCSVDCSVQYRHFSKQINDLRPKARRNQNAKKINPKENQQLTADTSLCSKSHKHCAGTFTHR